MKGNASSSSQQRTGISSSESFARDILSPLFRKFEWGFAALIIFLSSGAVLQGLLRMEGAAEDPVWIRYVWGAIYATTAFLIVVRRNQVRRIFRMLMRDWGLLVLLVYAMLSFLWATDVGLTGRRVIILGATTMLGAYLAVRFPLYEIFRITGITMFFAGILSVLAVIVAPDIAVEYSGRFEFKGIFGNKNILARSISLGAVSGFFIWRDRRAENSKFWILVFIFLSAITIVSNSATSLVALVLVLFLSPIFSVIKLRGKILIPSAIFSLSFILGVIYFVLENMRYVVSLLGRDLSFSGRVAIWTTTVAMIGARPWFGYGYGADWAESAGAFAYLLEGKKGEFPSAHNGILQVSFEIGIIGMTLLASHVVTFVKRAIGWVRAQRGSQAAYLPLAFLIMVLTSNLTQSTLLSRNGLDWILYVAMSLSVTQLLSQHRS